MAKDTNGMGWDGMGAWTVCSAERLCNASRMCSLFIFGYERMCSVMGRDGWGGGWK